MADQSLSAGRKINDYVSLIDLAPTILSATNILVPEAMTGKNLMPQLQSKESGWIESSRDFVVTGREKHVYRRPARAIRTKDFLYVRNFSPESWEDGDIEWEGMLNNDFDKNPWPTVPGAFSFDIDPSPTKQWLTNNASKDEVLKKLVLWADRFPHEELYDLNEDPEQLNNLLGNPNSVLNLFEKEITTERAKYADVRNRLSAELTKALRESGDPRFALPDHSTFKIYGWKVHLNDKLWQDHPEKTITMLGLMTDQLAVLDGRDIDEEADLKDLELDLDLEFEKNSELKPNKGLIPNKALKHLKTVPIWINWTMSWSPCGKNTPIPARSNATPKRLRSRPTLASHW
jgi:hypothetical protein